MGEPDFPRRAMRSLQEYLRSAGVDASFEDGTRWIICERADFGGDDELIAALLERLREL